MQKDNKKYSILIVEDNPGDVVLISDYLEEEIAIPKLEVAENYAQSREFLLNEKYRFDVILLDLSLPDSSGEALVEEIIRISKNALVIVLTGYSNLDFGKKCLSLGASDYLLKDSLSPTILYKSIIYAIERNGYLNQLKDSQRRYFDLFKLSPQPMWVCDTESLKFLHVNNAAVELYGYSKDELLEMSIPDIIPDHQPSNYHTNETSKVLRQTVHLKKNGDKIIVDERSNNIDFNGEKARVVLAIDITENRKLQEKLQLNTYLVENRERKRISSTLHEGLQQTILASYMRFEFIKNNISKIHEAKYTSRFTEAVTYLKEAINQTRNLAHTIVPVQIEEEGIVFAINDLISKNSNLNVHYDFVENIGDQKLPINLEVLLYRIAQEGTNNIIKYAKASSVQYHLMKNEVSVSLKIVDDGIGFDPITIINKTSYGLQSIKGRVESLAGNFQIKSELGKGSSIEATLPLSSGISLTND
ncbi:response regulator [Roseivirga sp.]|uniref:response regulator n=1 Tax=Roseivirga sp. TaxID=1964215 RepID=UPI002B269378|nr:response regulator [Roseivirga sp.]